jgi:hypothetical protein
VSDFDPLAILAALERHRAAYVVVGDLAGVLQGSGMIARRVEITPSLKAEGLARLDRALGDLGVGAKARSRLGRLDPGGPALSFRTDRGEIDVDPTPAGSGGYDDLRRAAQREPLGQGLRVPVASAPDLVRVLAAQGRERDLALERRLRRVIELERAISPEI